MKSWLTLIGVVLLLVLVLGGIKFHNIQQLIKAGAAKGQPRATVTAMKAAYSEWIPSAEAVGTLRAVRGVNVSSEVAGSITALHFASGQQINAGAVLVELVADTDRARLASLSANADLALANFNRSSEQFKAEVGSKAQLDSDKGALDAARAAVREQEAIIAKKIIRAPFSGSLGISSLATGHYLTPGEGIVSLTQLDPIYIDFFVPQEMLDRLETGRKISARSNTAKGEVFHGEITALEPVVDHDTRNVKVQATLANPRHHLLPGMFASVTLQTGAAEKFLTLPQTAVAFNPYGETVFVIGEATPGKDADGRPTPAPTEKDGSASKQVRQVFVTTGNKRGDQVAVLTGIEEGDEVVTSGQLKLKPGGLVLVNNEIQPGNSPDPQPKDP